jgi:predicted RNA-binding Zn ribbon-like protein
LDSKTTMIDPEFVFIGEDLCLDFANTVGGLPPDSITQDRLTNYARLVAWGQQAKLTSESEAQLLLHKAERAPVEASAILERAHVLREAIYGIFTALAEGMQPTDSDLDLLNREVGWGMAGARVVVTSDGFEWEWRKEAGAFDQMLGAVARSAGMLLTSAERQYVRQCANESCHWLFVDTTKNHRRRWCRTTGCGNMVRVRNHRERQQGKNN